MKLLDADDCGNRHFSVGAAKSRDQIFEGFLALEVILFAHVFLLAPFP